MSRIPMNGGGGNITEILNEKGTNNFATTGEYTTKTIPITEDGLYFIAYSQFGTMKAAVWSIISLNGTDDADHIMQVSTYHPNGSPCAEATTIVHLSAGDVIYLRRISTIATSSSDRTYNINVIKLS